MKILILSWYFPPTNSMGALRLGKLAHYLNTQGHDVRVLSARDLPWRQTLDQAFPEDRVVRTSWWNVNAPPRIAARLRNRLRRSNERSKGSRSGAPMADIGSADFKAGEGGVLRALSRTYMSLTNWPDESIGWLPSAFRAGRRMVAVDRPDVIFASGPPFTTLVLGHLLASRTNIPWVAEFRDRWWDDPYNTLASLPTSPWRTKLERVLERWLMRSAAGISTVSEPWAESYRLRYGKPTLTVYNGYDPASLLPESPGAAGNPRLMILYTGIIYPGGRRDPTPLFAALRNMPRANEVRVQFYGCSPSDVMPLAVGQEVGHLVEVCPPVSHKEAMDLQRNADVLLLMQWNDPGEQGNVPGKLFEYLAARRPILGHGYTEGVPARIINERAAGLYSNDPDQISRQLGAWLTMKQEMGSLPALPKSVYAGFSAPEQFEKLEQLFSRLSPG